MDIRNNKLRKLRENITKSNLNTYGRDNDRRTNQKLTYVNLPYINGTSNILRRIFNEHIISNQRLLQKKHCAKSYLIQKTNSQEKKSNVVYQIPCNVCEAVYIGETKRTLLQRVQEHKRAVRNADTEKNEIADHSWTKDHQFNWNEKKIIDQEKAWIARKITETIHSIENDKHINSTSYNLADIWLPAVRKDSYHHHFCV